MASFSNEEYADILYCYGLPDGNAVAAQSAYEERFPSRRLPDRRVFATAYRRVREGTLFEHRRDRSRTHFVQDMRDRVIELVTENPETSVSRIALSTGISTASVWRLLKDENLRPFHFTPVQELLPPDFEKRREFCNWLLERNFDDYTFIERIIWTDESQFAKTGCLNFHDLHTWAEENPRKVRKYSTQHRFSVNVWAGIIGKRLIGPCILPDRMNSENYLSFLQTTISDELDNIPLSIWRDMWYQHDGAPSHYGQGVRLWLNHNFPNRWIGRLGPINWPPRSPDLTPLDFYLWGEMKQIVYQKEVNTKEELVNRSEEAEEG